ncbi:MAG TPA: hypothetical protein DDZ51_29430 [Planctomycetaceae bacterium]|nr:hypothetical protein [Planctomycetaceae bacterium]
MGEIKKGKSSFINGMLGEADLLPMSSNIATSTVFKIIYGPERKYKVFFLPDPESGALFPPKEIERKHLVDYGTEGGNPSNEKRVDFIGVELPIPLLETGLVIVDTPGVGGLFKAHRDITWRYAPNADAIIFVLDSVEAVISSDEIDFLKDLTTKYNKRVFFVQTKIDNASEELWRGWASRNKQILASHVGMIGKEVLYFPVSAKLKAYADAENDLEDLVDSGYPPLMNFINGYLVPAKEIELAKDTARKLEAVSTQIHCELSAQLSIAKETTISRLAEIEATRRQAVEDFAAWEREYLDPALSEATERLHQRRRTSLDQLDEILNPSGRMLLEFLEGQAEKSGEDISCHAGVIQQDFMEMCGRAIGKVFDNYTSDFTAICDRIVEKLSVKSVSGEIASAMTQGIDVDYRKVDSLSMSASSGFETARNMMFGGLGGMAIASVALNVVSVAFPPLAAFNLVVWAGGLYGATEMKRLATERRKDEALSKLRGLLSEQLSQIRRSVIRQFEDKADDCSKSLNTIIKSAASQAKRNLDARLEDVKGAGARTKEEAIAIADSLDRKLKQLAKAAGMLQSSSTSS